MVALPGRDLTSLKFSQLGIGEWRNIIQAFIMNPIHNWSKGTLFVRSLVLLRSLGYEPSRTPGPKNVQTPETPRVKHGIGSPVFTKPSLVALTVFLDVFASGAVYLE